MGSRGTTALPAATRSEVEAALSRTHRVVEAAMGQLCLTLIQRRFSRRDVLQWAGALREGASELERLAEQLRKD